MIKHFVLFIMVAITGLGFSQELNPVHWETTLITKDSIHFVRFQANIEPGWYLYATELPEDGPIPTQFVINDQLITENIKAESEHEINLYDDMFMMELTKYKEEVHFDIPLNELSEVDVINGYVEFMCCNDMQCLAPKKVNFTINLN